MELKKATELQRQQTIINNYVEWGYPQLEIKEYFARESVLSAEQFAQFGQTCWVLVDGDKILSACETYKRYCHVKINNKVERKSCYSIASVFTPKCNRNKGYASEMMMLLHKEFVKDDECVASVLYSDVDEVFYSKLGWKKYPSTCFQVAPEQVPIASIVGKSLFKADLEKIITKQHDEIIYQLNSSMTDTQPTFYIEITWAAVSWRIARTVFYATTKHRQYKTFGASIEDHFAIWVHDFKTNDLEIIYFNCNNKQAANTLLYMAAQECAQSGLETITIWTPNAGDKHLFSVEQVKERSDALSSLCMYGKCKDLQVDWICNENYAWV